MQIANDGKSYTVAKPDLETISYFPQFEELLETAQSLQAARLH